MYPSIPQTSVQDLHFGKTLNDPYHYMEQKDHPDTLAATAAQNAYTRSFFEADPAYASTYDAVKNPPKADKLLHMAEANGVLCASRIDAHGQTDIVMLDSHYQVTDVLVNDAMLDNRMHVYYATPCPTVKGIFAVLAVKHGAPRCTVVVYDEPRQAVLAELDGTFDFSWSSDGAAIYYADVSTDSAQATVHTVHKYLWQTQQSETLYTYTDACVFIRVCEAQPDGCFLFVMKGYDDILALWRAEDGTVTPMNDGRGSCQYVGRQNRLCYFITNRTSPMGAIVSLPVESLSTPECLHHAKTVAVTDDCLLTNACILPSSILAFYESDAVSKVQMLDFQGVPQRDLAIPCAYSAISTDGVLTLSDTGKLYLDFESFTLPPQTMLFDANTGQLSLAMGDAAIPDDIIVEQCFLPARDNQRILVYITRLQDHVPNPDTPAMLYGYGGYNVSSTPTSRNPVTEISIVDWVRKGRIYAHCILRGGGEYGSTWHEAGMKANKKNAFFDFIDIARYLVAKGLTSPQRLIATGLSNGGLLVTAATTLAPDAFGCVIASVPHTDMIRFREDDRGSMYVTEYGDPQADADMFAYMLSYSPYHNIREGVQYPAMYLQTGEMDNNVPSYHAKKFAAQMQRSAKPGQPILLTVLAHGSHNRGVGDEHDLTIAQMRSFIEQFLR